MDIEQIMVKLPNNVYLTFNQHITDEKMDDIYTQLFDNKEYTMSKEKSYFNTLTKDTVRKLISNFILSHNPIIELQLFKLGTIQITIEKDKLHLYNHLILIKITGIDEPLTLEEFITLSIMTFKSESLRAEAKQYYLDHSGIEIINNEIMLVMA